MLKYILKRLGLSIIILLGVSLIIYFLVRMMPTNYLDTKFSAAINGGTITQEQVDAFKEMYGIADNSFGGILKGYFKWIGNLVRLDLGDSFIFEKPVSTAIAENMWVSFFIAFIATVFQTSRYHERDSSVFGARLLGNRAHHDWHLASVVLLRGTAHSRVCERTRLVSR